MPAIKCRTQMVKNNSDRSTVLLQYCTNLAGAYIDISLKTE